MIKERIGLKGKDLFLDLHGNQGIYRSAMGPNMKQQTCLICGTSIEKLSLGGGQVYFCPKCKVQKWAHQFKLHFSTTERPGY